MPNIGEEDFDRAVPYIQAALAYGNDELNLAEVKEHIEDGKMQLWAGVTSAIVTELVDYPRHRALHFTLAGGNLPEIEAMLPVIEAWGRSQGATRSTLSGRPGWTRSFLRDQGWRATHVLMTKAL